MQNKTLSIVGCSVFILALLTVLFDTFFLGRRSFGHLKSTLGSHRLSKLYYSSEREDARYVFMTYLTEDLLKEDVSGASTNGTMTDEEDGFFLSTRLLAYQLLHAPSTRSRPYIPFVVLVTEDVSSSKRAELKRTGAQVVQIEKITIDWITSGIGAPHWRDMLGKLRLWKFTQYEKICFIDADHMILNRIDSVFQDPATSVQPSGNLSSELPEDEGPIPAHFMIAGMPDGPPGREIPPGPTGYMNAGFFVTSPSQELFDYYMSVAHIENRFFPVYPEQSLINYAHRPEGNMPWRTLDWHFNVHNGGIQHYRAGIKTFHDKFWVNDTIFRQRDTTLKALWTYQMAEMEMFFANSN